MKIVICDDEEYLIDYLVDKIHSLSKKLNISVSILIYKDGQELLSEYQETRFKMDLLFLDIHMPNMDGDKVLEMLREMNYENDVIFFTVSTKINHFKKAIKHGALDYIIKDVSTEEEIEEIFIRAVKDYMQKEKEYISVSFADEIKNIIIDDIHYFEYVDHKVAVHYGNGKVFFFWETMNKLEKQLEFHGFLRIHSAFLVNMNKILTVRSGEVEMKNQDMIRFNKKRTREIRSIYERYLGVKTP